MFKVLNNRHRGMIFILLSLVAAMSAAGISYFGLNTAFKKVPVFVAIEEIAPGDPLKKELFEVRSLARGGIPEDTLKPDFIFDGTISAKGMLPGDVLRKKNTVNMQDRDISVLSTRLRTVNEDEMVAVEIPVESMKGMLGGMKAWDTVMIGVAWPDKDKEMLINTKNAQFVTEIIVESAIVVGLRKAEDGNNGALIVGLDSAQFLKYMESKEKGKIYVALHPLGYGGQISAYDPDVVISPNDQITEPLEATADEP